MKMVTNRQNTDAQELLRKIEKPLLDWFSCSKRELPWRTEPTPYHVWISEIMLQQTRVEAVKAYYRRFMEALPDIASLAACPDDVLMKLWEGLGYYSRARNLKKAAIELMEHYEGALPADPAKLIKLPGIGPYTCGAISSIAFQLPVPAVDGNVLRVISRILGSYADIALPAVRKEIEALLANIIPENKAGDYNQALMEIGALVCVPTGPPHCDVCPVKELCIACKEQLTDKIPVKTPNKKRRIEEKTVLILQDGIYTFLRKRPAKGLLGSLYEPMVLEGHLSEKEITGELKKYGIDPVRFKPLPNAKHIFTHIEWHMKGYHVLVQDLEAFAGNEEKKEDIQEQSGFAALPEEIRVNYSVPSAYAAYRAYMTVMEEKNQI